MVERISEKEERNIQACVKMFQFVSLVNRVLLSYDGLRVAYHLFITLLLPTFQFELKHSGVKRVCGCLMLLSSNGRYWSATDNNGE